MNITRILKPTISDAAACMMLNTPGLSAGRSPKFQHPRKDLPARQNRELKSRAKRLCNKLHIFCNIYYPARSCWGRLYTPFPSFAGLPLAIRPSSADRCMSVRCRAIKVLHYCVFISSSTQLWRLVRKLKGPWNVIRVLFFLISLNLCLTRWASNVGYFVPTQAYRYWLNFIFR